MLLLSFLIALYKQNSALLDALKNKNLALLLALVGGIGIDYSVRG
nr:hypothetical protein [Pyrococcus abyssi]